LVKPDGAVSITFNGDKSHKKGAWTIAGDMLQLHIPMKLMGVKKKEFKIFGFPKDQFFYQSQKTSKVQTVKKLN